MFTAKTYLFAQSLDQAYEILQANKTNTVLGGCGWLKMGRKRIWTAIDLTRLGLDYIVESEDEIRIGACVTLRQLETCKALNEYFGGIISKCVQHIVGVQFRNSATVGASVFMRAGYSDLVTALLALDTSVELHHAGIIPLKEFVKMPYTKDIVTQIIIKKDGREAAYESMRLSATDFPVLTVAVSRCQNKWNVCVGARPNRAAKAEKAARLLAEGDWDSAGAAAADELDFGSNMRASEEYRQALAKVLVRRAARRISKGRSEENQ